MRRRWIALGIYSATCLVYFLFADPAVVHTHTPLESLRVARGRMAARAARSGRAAPRVHRRQRLQSCRRQMVRRVPALSSAAPAADPGARQRSRARCTTVSSFCGSRAWHRRCSFSRSRSYAASGAVSSAKWLTSGSACRSRSGACISSVQSRARFGTPRTWSAPHFQRRTCCSRSKQSGPGWLGSRSDWVSPPHAAFVRRAAVRARSRTHFASALAAIAAFVHGAGQCDRGAHLDSQSASLWRSVRSRLPLFGHRLAAPDRKMGPVWLPLPGKKSGHRAD